MLRKNELQYSYDSYLEAHVLSILSLHLASQADTQQQEYLTFLIRGYTRWQHTADHLVSVQDMDISCRYHRPFPSSSQHQQVLRWG